jgi:hypothetical protein
LEKELIVYIIRDGKMIPIHVQLDWKEVTLSAVAAEPKSLKAITELDELLHNIGFHEQKGCPSVEETGKIIIMMR